MAQRGKMNKTSNQRYIGLGLLLFVLIALIIVVSYLYDKSTKTEVNLNDSTHFTMTGFNGSGEMSAVIDVQSGYEAFFDTVRISLSKSTGLSNGDEIIVSYTYDAGIAKAYNLKVIAEEKHIVVKELVDPTVISNEDFFEGVSLIYEGIAPLVTVTLDVNNKFNGYVTYEVVDAKEYYNVGDLVKVRAFYDDASLAEIDSVAEMSSEECVKEFTVTDVDRYVTETSDITDEMLASLKKEALSLFTDANEYGMRIFCDAGLMPMYVNGKTTFQWNSPSYLSAYLNVLKESGYGKIGSHVNEVMLCYETVVSQADGQACRAEVIIMFSDIIIRKDGTVELNLESGDLISADRRDSHIKAIARSTTDDDYMSSTL